MTLPPHILLVGGGHATMALLKQARDWTRSGQARVTLLNDHPALYYSGMVPEYLGGVYPARQAQIDLKGWCRRSGVQWRLGRAVALEGALGGDERAVHTASGASLAFDLAVFDVGARTPGAPPGVIPTKPLHRVERLERFVRAALKEASRNGQRRRLVIVGGGAAGAEIALNVSARLHAVGRPQAVSLALAEASDRLLPAFPNGMGEYAARVLRRRGVDVRLGTRVDAFTDGAAVLTSGDALSCEEVLWATGAIGPSLFHNAGLACDERGFVRVRPSLQCAGAPRIFAAGDCAVVEGHEHLARVGVHAVKQGPLLADNVERALDALRRGRNLAGASYQSFEPYPLVPLILSTGRREGLWTAGGRWLRGAWALRLKHFIDLRWMNRYRLRSSQVTGFFDALHARSAYPARRL